MAWFPNGTEISAHQGLQGSQTRGREWEKKSRRGVKTFSQQDHMEAKQNYNK